MFNLENEIEAWCKSVHPFGFGRKAKIAELKDHLYSAIEHHQETGLSEEEAFNQAIEKMGNSDDLAKEYAKNKSLISSGIGTIIEFEEMLFDKWRISISPKQAAISNIIISLIFAAGILLASYFLADDDGTNQTVTFIFIAIWFVPFTFLSAFGTKKQERKSC